jgi:hypothetical protein
MHVLFILWYYSWIHDLPYTKYRKNTRYTTLLEPSDVVENRFPSTVGGPIKELCWLRLRRMNQGRERGRVKMLILTRVAFCRKNNPSIKEK